MQALKTYDYAIIRVVPRVERGEFINVGVILWCSATHFLGVQIDINSSKILALDPEFDLESITKTLEAIPQICVGGKESGPIGQLSLRERFDWLTAPRSSSLQTSVVHTGRGNDMKAALDQIFESMVL